MKIIKNIKNAVLLISLLLCGNAYSQITDKNPIYSVEGTGYTEINAAKRINFSKISIQGTGTNEISLDDNAITISKDGIYRISLPSEVKVNNEMQQVKYYLHLNEKAGFEINQKLLSSGSKYFVQMQLKEGDRLKLDIIGNDINYDISNTISVQPADPKLITFSDDHDH